MMLNATKNNGKDDNVGPLDWFQSITVRTPDIRAPIVINFCIFVFSEIPNKVRKLRVMHIVPKGRAFPASIVTVSYTHLTLPTILLV